MLSCQRVADCSCLSAGLSKRGEKGEGKRQRGQLVRLLKAAAMQVASQQSIAHAGRATRARQSRCSVGVQEAGCLRRSGGLAVRCAASADDGRTVAIESSQQVGRRALLGAGILVPLLAGAEGAQAFQRPPSGEPRFESAPFPTAYSMLWTTLLIRTACSARRLQVLGR